MNVYPPTDWTAAPDSDTPELVTAVYEAVGAASVCWNDQVDDEGVMQRVFDSDQACCVAEALLERIRDVTGYRRDLVPASREPEEVERWLSA